ncbi:MAG TPA: acetyl-CoA carboxylase biotin carboxylase subunit [Candidatus Eremiobacteraceae bacterium]|nr:acetyl-CoA carboxylase biotin carboxylase subunit [Candidatus Eremiobacteraceae bacterium]
MIANRGEIAVRIARTCRAMGIHTVAIYSDPDKEAVHVRACDAAVRIGPAAARQSYLRADAIVEAARASGADAIHPGYGFLSENADFAAACSAAGIAFVGPPPHAMRAMGDKIAAKRTVGEAGVPTVPGYLGDEQSFEVFEAEAKRIGAPLLVKAAAGGGGKGMRIVRDPADLRSAIEGAKREAGAAFGDDTVFLERYLSAPRHVEIQVLADASGACIHLGERECSVQRRHQKVLEETPSTAVDAALRARMGAAAVQAALAVGYVNAGTVEFMLDADGSFYFLEMNTRLQVEHPITESVLGIDLVREQLWIAAGKPLAFSQDEMRPRGHAIEVRVYAEDASNGFLPCTGMITAFGLPEGPGIRNDAGVALGTVVSSDYDPMLAKLIVSDRTRGACIERLTAALDDYRIGGVGSNLPFLRWLVSHEAFQRGETTTDFIERHFTTSALAHEGDQELALMAAAAALGFGFERSRPPDPWRALGPWRQSQAERTVHFGRPLASDVRLTWDPRASAWWCSAGDRTTRVSTTGNGEFVAQVDGTERPFVAWPLRGGIGVAFDSFFADCVLALPPAVAESAKGHRHAAHGSTGSVAAPMSGTVVKVAVAPGADVEAHQVLVVMEAMKMEHSIAAPHAGCVAEISVAQGDTVAAGDVLVRIDA